VCSSPSQIKDYNIGICRFFAKNEALRIWYLLLYTCVSHQLPNCITLSAYYLLFIVALHILPMIYYLLLHCTFYLWSTIYCWIAYFTYDLLFIVALHILPMIYYLLLDCTFYLWSTIYCCIAHFTYDLLFIVALHILPVIYYLFLDCTFYLWSTIYCWIAHFTYYLLFIVALHILPMIYYLLMYYVRKNHFLFIGMLLWYFTHSTSTL
jgi:hypothetical protein